MLLLVLPTLASIKWTLEKVTESIALYCQSSSKQAWQNSSYFSRLHCAIYTYNMAAAALNIDSNDAIVTLSIKIGLSYVTYC